MNTKSWVSVIVVVVVVGVAAFFGGLQVGKKGSSSTAKSATAASGGYGAGGSSAAGRPAGGGRAGGFAGAGGISGQIISMDSSSITVKTQTGSTEIVYFSGTTPITKEQTIAPTALATGDNVIVRGSSSSGTITATNISVVPTLPTASATGTTTTNGAASGQMPMNMPMNMPMTQGQ